MRRTGEERGQGRRGEAEAKHPLLFSGGSELSSPSFKKVPQQVTGRMGTPSRD